ncbi:MAG: exodeoxyribonuclease V subunit beta [Pseudomonadota bacterium]
MAERHFVPLDSPFEVELTGTRLLEAGAGTGKTWMLAALVLRLLLEQQIEIGKILVVTYTRAASGELRGRVRARLVEALAAFDAGRADEPYLQALVERIGTTGTAGATAARVRLRLAIESFDEASIFTIHGFCQRALGETAFAAGQAFERELIADQGELLAAVARDAWRREMATASPLWAQWLIDHVQGPEGLAAIVRSHLGRVDARLEAPAQVDRKAAEQRFAAAFVMVRDLWKADAARILDWLAGAKLNQQSYSAKKMQPRSVALGLWLSAEPPLSPLLPLPEGIEHFGLAKIAAKLNKGGQLPQHAFFAAMDELLQSAGELQAACESATRRLLQDFLLTARTGLAERKRRSGQQTYDDLLVDLAQALDGPAGPRLVDSLRARYRIALVDEFQDTDPLQLRIFMCIFGTDERPLIFVGDPKQAIYGFRGADVFAYLKARTQADTGYALLENRRSDPPLLKAVNALFARPLPFLLDGMPYEPSRAADRVREICRIDDDAAPLSLWTMQAPEGGKGFPKDTARTMAAEAVAADIARLLGLSATGRATLGERPLGGGDIAVLVRRHRDGDLVRQALARHGIPSVSGGGGSVWHSDEAVEIERLLLAVAAPAREGLVRAALATILLGADAAQLAAWLHDEPAWSARLDCFHDDLLLFRERGFMAMWRRLLRREGVVARVLERPDGERRLTNYRHLAELLQAAEQGAALDVEGLARHIAQQRQAPEGEESQLRLESDAHLVRIVTLHAAKGLQYPIVYCPFLWLGPEEDKTGWPVLAHHEGKACLDFGSEGIDGLRAAADREDAAEELRLAYVALTRAEHRCILAWGKVNNCARSPLAWLLFGPRESVAEEPRVWLARWLETHDESAALHALEAGLDRALKVMPLPGDGSAPLPPAETVRAHRPRDFMSKVPAPWRVQSFSSLAARLSEEAETADRDAVVPASAVPPAPTFSNIQNFPRGTRAGSCLHALFERIDFQGRTPVGPTAAATLVAFGYAPDWQPVLERLVADVLGTTLNADGLRLADVPRGERLVELEFTFPFGSAAERAGYMKGFIDLVFRHAGRWYIVDWKSNWLEDYGPASLAAAMQAHRYELQARIYAAALKRALAVREPQNDWESSFGGMFYLFLRGMAPGSSDGIHFFRPAIDEIAEFLS